MKPTVEISKDTAASAPIRAVNTPRKARLLAFYLPQFHPTPENDTWWGKGFTEWTNVAKARPMFPGHWQPRLPADLGFYDLRVPEVREEQARLAATHGIEAFCYWHYWFGHGKRLLERPFLEMLRSGKPDFPFCLAWANVDWEGSWYGARHKLLVRQEYPGREDYVRHFEAVAEALADPRNLTIDGRKVFFVLTPRWMPDAVEFSDCWRDLAARRGIGELYLIGYGPRDTAPRDMGFDAWIVLGQSPRDILRYVRPPLATRHWNNRIMRYILRRPLVYDYRDAVRCALPARNPFPFTNFPCIYPNWDNTPRAGHNGLVFVNSDPGCFKDYLRASIRYVQSYAPQERLVFIKSWNEWAEGNYLEPDRRFGLGWLEAVRDVLDEPGVPARQPQGAP